ncbi:Small GTPase like protein [Aduncisulcus paluster]|uniref:Small GTPase like protein n=1 Tax=Aduncisulcus paluster TaxID=2918883 RepID=A0ABQ5K1E9_9EUKA|nr:Small GTPase like protein [Aduncisulcus paluster]
MEDLKKPPKLFSRRRKPVLQLKVFAAGDSRVGKSCLIKRYCEKKFEDKYIATIGIDYGVKTVEIGKHTVKINLWDSAGHAAYIDIRNEFYRDTQGLILVFDLSKKSTLSSCETWFQEAMSNGFDPSRGVVVIMGNKSDQPRAVSEEEGRKMAKKYNAAYFEVSAQSGHGVEASFNKLFTALYKKYAQ